MIWNMLGILLKRRQKKRVYLDYAAATPLFPAARKAMEPYLGRVFGNASAIHQEGLEARRAVELAREQIATSLQVRPEFVTFTSGGTESNNLAIRGVIKSLKAAGRGFADMEVITTKIEHPSVIETMKSLERRGVIVKYVPVDSEGIVKLQELKEMLTEKTVLFSVAYANSEIGTVQSVRAISKILKSAEEKFKTNIFFHLDAAQAPLWLSCQFSSLQADLVAFDVGKCNGPKGVGILVRSRRVELKPTSLGGGQESGLRAGTENVAGLVGAAVALTAAQADFQKRAAQVASVRDKAIIYLQTEIPESVLNGPAGDERLSNNINISIPGLDTEFATVVLDKHGFAVSTKSACAGAGGGESVVVREISADPARAASTLRISLAPDTKLADLKRLAKVLKKHIKKMKKLGC